MININYEMSAPCLIAVSGGRTSGFMLRQILDAHGGSLPNGVHAVFNNTGLEHESALLFLRDISIHWGVHIHWLEYRHTPDADKKHTYVEVNFQSASRNGEPFTQLITAKQMLPNPMTRFCTAELKIRTSNRWAKDQGYDEWHRAVGLRWDEPRRVSKLKGDIKSEMVLCPMSDAKHTLDDVTDFWTNHPFDLNLPGNDDAFGNCSLCFLKGKHKIAKVIRSRPDLADWWIEQESRTDLGATGDGRTFRIDRPTYHQIRTQLDQQGNMFDDAIEDDTLPCNCTD